jgi:NifB/MoaA-like Fe-S oxidoreductase
VRRSRRDKYYVPRSGKLFYPFLRDCIEQFNRKLGSGLEVVEVENRFMGKSITVAGLLAGQDFASALANRRLGDFVIIPNESVSQVEGVFADDWSPDDLARRLGKPVFPSGRTRATSSLCSSISSTGAREQGGHGSRGAEELWRPREGQGNLN